MKVYLARMTPDNPLCQHTQGFNTNFVYSFLLKQARFNNLSTAYEIAKACDLPQDYSVRSALDLLESLGLAKKEDGKWLALPPQCNWYVPKKEPSEHWADGFAYFPMAISYSTLTTKQNAVYWAIQAKPGQRQCWYGLVLGIGTSTTTRTINKLRRMGLVSVKGYYANPNIPEKWKNIWTKSAKQPKEKTPITPVFAESSIAPAPAKTEKPVLQNENAVPAPATVKTEKQVLQNDLIEKSEFKIFAEKAPEILENWRKPIASLVGLLKKKNYSESDCIDVVNKICGTCKIWANEQAFHEIFLIIQKIINYAETITKQNRQQSKFFGPNSKGILLSEIDNAHEQMAIALTAVGPDSNVLIWEYSPKNIDV